MALFALMAGREATFKEIAHFRKTHFLRALMLSSIEKVWGNSW